MRRAAKPQQWAQAAQLLFAYHRETASAVDAPESASPEQVGAPVRREVTDPADLEARAVAGCDLPAQPARQLAGQQVCWMSAATSSSCSMRPRCSAADSWALTRMTTRTAGPTAAAIRLNTRRSGPAYPAPSPPARGEGAQQLPAVDEGHEVGGARFPDLGQRRGFEVEIAHRHRQRPRRLAQAAVQRILTGYSDDRCAPDGITGVGLRWSPSPGHCPISPTGGVGCRRRRPPD